MVKGQAMGQNLKLEDNLSPEVCQHSVGLSNPLILSFGGRIFDLKVRSALSYKSWLALQL